MSPFCSPVCEPLIIHSSSSFPHQRHLSSQNQTHKLTLSLTNRCTCKGSSQTSVWSSYLCVIIPCTSVSVIYRSTVSSIYTAPACSPQQILLIVSRMQQPRCDSSSLDMCCFLSVCSQSLVLYSSDYLHCVSLVIVLYAAQCTVALAHCASYRLPPSLPSLSLSSCFSLFQTTAIITLHTALRRGEHIRVNPFCLAALMFVAMLCWSIKTDTATHEALKSGSLKCVF